MVERPAALITGGAIRLGYHFAKTLAAHGYDIAVHYNNSEEEAKEAAGAIRAIGVDCEIFPWNFLSGTDPSPLVDEVVAVFPRLSLLVNSASTYNAGPVTETTMEILKTEFMVNFFTPFLLSGAFARIVRKGNIINILDNKISFQQFQYAAYLSAKKALAELTMMTAMEFAPGIRVNGIAPGVVLPGVSRSDDYIQWRVDGIPLQRQGRLEELERALLYILDNEYVTGQKLFVDGGEGLLHIGQNAMTYHLR